MGSPERITGTTAFTARQQIIATHAVKGVVYTII